MFLVNVLLHLTDEHDVFCWSLKFFIVDLLNIKRISNEFIWFQNMLFLKGDINLKYFLMYQIKLPPANPSY